LIKENKKPADVNFCYMPIKKETSQWDLSAKLKAISHCSLSLGRGVRG
jgi:hypothetical protein